MNKSFKGPIFIVGMPRSGTKLLQSLLNNHSLVCFAQSETKILPFWESQWEKYGDLKEFANFERFYEEAEKHSFFSYMRECHSRYIDAEEWHKACTGWDVASVFEALVKLDAGFSDGMIWGEKSPYYRKHIPLLKRLYPDAKVIHIVRDVRDYCLSINRAWGKNIIRAAQRWQDDTSLASSDLKGLGSDGLEIRYEDLLSNSEQTLTDLCEFLGVQYEATMVELKKSPENLGEATGAKAIVSQNKEKWRTRMNKSVIQKIESLCISQLNSYQYQSTYQGTQARVGELESIYYKLLDGVNLVFTDSDNRGWFKNLIFYVRDYTLKSKHS